MSLVSDVVSLDNVARNCSGRLDTGGGLKRLISASVRAVGVGWAGLAAPAAAGSGNCGGGFDAVVVVSSGAGSERAKGVRVSEGGIRGKAAVEKT